MTIELYDNNGATADRYTAVFLEQEERKPGHFVALSMDEKPFHPQGIGQHTSAMPGPHLGKRIRLTDMPPDCRKLVLAELDERWKQCHFEDYDLTAEQLDDKYNPDGDGEHPYFTRKEWRNEVANENTCSGYWLWMQSEIDSEKNDLSEIIDAGVSDIDPMDVLSETIRFEYFESGCQASDLDHAVRRLLDECGELFESEANAVGFIMEAPLDESDDEQPGAESPAG